MKERKVTIDKTAVFHAVNEINELAKILPTEGEEVYLNKLGEAFVQGLTNGVTRESEYLVDFGRELCARALEIMETWGGDRAFASGLRQGLAEVGMFSHAELDHSHIYDRNLERYSHARRLVVAIARRLQFIKSSGGDASTAPNEGYSELFRDILKGYEVEDDSLVWGVLGGIVAEIVSLRIYRVKS